MNIIENLISGNISDAKKKARNRSFMWLINQGEEMGFSPSKRWSYAAFLKNMISLEEYNDHGGLRSLDNWNK